MPRRRKPPDDTLWVKTRITEEEAAFLERLGSGNRSRGLRVLLSEFQVLSGLVGELRALRSSVERLGSVGPRAAPVPTVQIGQGVEGAAPPVEGTPEPVLGEHQETFLNGILGGGL